MNLSNARWHFVDPQRRCEISALTAGRWRVSENHLHPRVRLETLTRVLRGCFLSVFCSRVLICQTTKE